MPCSPASVSLLYPCDLPEAEWPHLAPLFPAPAQRGRPRAWPLRLLVNALFYVLRTGWVVYLLVADNVSRLLPIRLPRVNQPVLSSRNGFSTPHATLLT